MSQPDEDSQSWIAEADSMLNGPATDDEQHDESPKRITVPVIPADYHPYKHVWFTALQSAGAGKTLLDYFFGTRELGLPAGPPTFIHLAYALVHGLLHHLADYPLFMATGDTELHTNRIYCSGLVNRSFWRRFHDTAVPTSRFASGRHMLVAFFSVGAHLFELYWTGQLTPSHYCELLDEHKGPEVFRSAAVLGERNELGIYPRLPADINLYQ